MTPDERYLVECYLKIAELQKNLHENPAVIEEKRNEVRTHIDGERIRRTLEELERKPERWLAVYARINELQYRALGSDSTR